MSAHPPLRLAIAGGGTGGHVLPALAVVEEFRARGVPLELLWIGSRGDVEGPAAERAGIPFRAIKTGKLRRYFAAETILDALRLPVGTAQAWRILRQFRPGVIFSTGGFVSVPTVVAGARLAPILTHEQTAILGLATRINLRFADVLAVSFEESAARASGFDGRVVVTGNPVRSSLRQGDAARGLARFGFSPDLPLLYVTGGARGASPLNQRVAALLPDLLQHCQVLHQAGPATANGDLKMLETLRARLSPELQRRYRPVAFVRDELADVYAAASLVLGRAGAGTIAELAYLGKPGLLIPLPGSGGGEQDANARALAGAGGAVVMAQEEATPKRLGADLESLLRDPDRLRTMGQRAASIARRDASLRLANELLALAGRT
ncbi:MAG: UDP-N-acetylglucosamine--N-acetylmuramyl-(pentapeptide) pyrophosphoryl-undecaprenol [Thermomicrobiales bacterium]|nr:UDP-N-acetylglucosamine--N-acetylmuramyl-(pentapeptide) pyrophosphoryl-undecaprenol [Thermomicrobiales bacterium]